MISRVSILCVLSVLILAVVVAGTGVEVEERQIQSLTSVAGSIISAGESGVSSLLSQATSEANGVFETVTSVGGQAVTVVTSVGGQAITLAGTAAGRVTSFAGSEYTVATAAYASATAKSGATSVGISTWLILLPLAIHYIIF